MLASTPTHETLITHGLSTEMTKVRICYCVITEVLLLKTVDNPFSRLCLKSRKLQSCQNVISSRDPFSF